MTNRIKNLRTLAPNGRKPTIFYLVKR